MCRLLRIAVLEADEPVGETKKKYGGFGTIFQELLEAGASRVGETGSAKPLLQVSSFDVVTRQEYPDLESIDAVLISGSRYDSFSAGKDDWIIRLVDFVQHILSTQHRVRVIGVCFGHQIVGRALGIMPQRNSQGWEVAVTSVELTEVGKKLFGLESLAIHQMHRDFVPTCPPGVESLGRSSRCEVQGLYAKGRLISLQGHPEFTGKLVDELLELRRGTVLSEYIYQDGKQRAFDHHDGTPIAATFLRFLLDDEP